jgi:tRNA (guanine-N7-)-methyltransferase
VRIRQHVNPLKSDFFRIPVAPLEVPPGLSLEVELGSAEAFYLMERAAEEPRGHYVGVEIRRELVASSNEECRRLGLGNVRSVFANMSVDLPRLFAPRSVHRFHLNFPDPWFKSRQHKRRVMSPSLVEELHALLAPGGELLVATDIFTIALDSMAALEAEPPRRSSNVVEPWTFLKQSPFAARSRRERQCEGDGTPIWRLHYQAIPG